MSSLGGFWQPQGPLYERTSPALLKRLERHRKRAEREQRKKDLRKRRFKDAILMDFYTRSAV